MPDATVNPADFLFRARRVRVWAGDAYPEPPRKRKTATLLAHLVDDEALADLRMALTTKPTDEDVRLMTWPGYAFELMDGQARRLLVVGYIAGACIRCEQIGDQPLADPCAVEHWLDRWAPRDL